MKLQVQFFLWFVIVGAVMAGWRFLPEWFWHYLFFLRIPLLIGALLLFFPAIATSKSLSSILKNLLILSGRWQIAFTILASTVAGVAVSVVTKIILESGPERLDIPAFQLINDWLPIFRFQTIVYLLLAIVLALPISWSVINSSKAEVKAGFKDQERWIGGVLGTLLSGGFLCTFKAIVDATFPESSSPIAGIIFGLRRISSNLIYSLFELSKSDSKGYFESGNELLLKAANFDALLFFSLLLVVYVVVFIIYNPKPISAQRKQEVPALFYVLLLFSVAALFLGNLTFFFDPSRISIVLAWLLLASLMYNLFQVDHFFNFKKTDHNCKINHNHKLAEQEADFCELLRKRLEKQDTEQDSSTGKTLVMVCASGGGIQAAGWTTKVLAGLQRQLGESFTQSIGLISSVSGGSVGAMYYLDRFTDQGFPPEHELDAMFESATANSLDAVGWGLAYPDLWRIILLPMLPSFLTPKIDDRGIALETNWQGEMKTPSDPKTLVSWRKELEKGNIPLPVLNSTIVETGERFLITPVSFPNKKKQDRGFFDFNSLFPGKDIDVVTAARLSATFPYISPICRAKFPQNETCQSDYQKYHFADGGYFDNSGFVTGLEWLNDILTSGKLNISKVLILQINPFPIQPLAHSSKKPGFSMAILGPLLGLFKVRGPVLKSRNLTEVELLDQWQNALKNCKTEKGIDLKYFPIFFPDCFDPKNVRSSKNSESDEKPLKYQPPLSWKLTQQEKTAIKNAWCSDKIKSQVAELKKLWKEEWNM